MNSFCHNAATVVTSLMSGRLARSTEDAVKMMMIIESREFTFYLSTLFLLLTYTVFTTFTALVVERRVKGREGHFIWVREGQFLF